MQDIVRSCTDNFGHSCTEFLQSILKSQSLNNVTDYAKACAANYSSACVEALSLASVTKSKDAMLDYARACRLNINATCVNEAISNEKRTDEWSEYLLECAV